MKSKYLVSGIMFFATSCVFIHADDSLTAKQKAKVRSFFTGLPNAEKLSQVNKRFNKLSAYIQTDSDKWEMLPDSSTANFDKELNKLSPKQLSTLQIDYESADKKGKITIVASNLAMAVAKKLVIASRDASCYVQEIVNYEKKNPNFDRLEKTPVLSTLFWLWVSACKKVGGLGIIPKSLYEPVK